MARHNPSRRDRPSARRLHLERQRHYDAFKRLRAGEVLAEFPFTLDGQHLVARDIRPSTGSEAGLAFYLVAWFLCYVGRGREAGPRVCMLDFKDTGDPHVYNAVEAGFGRVMVREKITCLHEHIYGLVWGGIWREDGTCLPDGLPLRQGQSR